MQSKISHWREQFPKFFDIIFASFPIPIYKIDSRIDTFESFGRIHSIPKSNFQRKKKGNKKNDETKNDPKDSIPAPKEKPSKLLKSFAIKIFLIVKIKTKN